MKTRLTNFYSAVFNSRKIEKMQKAIIAMAALYFLTEVVISIIQKW